MSSENILIITLFDTISLLGNEKTSKKEGLSPVTTRWRRARDSTRASADAWSLAVTTVHRTVALCRSSFESRPHDFNEKIKGSTLRCYLPFFGGEQGIRTLEAVLATYTISNRAPSTSSDNSPYDYCLAIIHEQS